MPSVSRVVFRTDIFTWFSRALMASSVVALSACSVAGKSLDDMSPSAKAAVQVQKHKTTAGHSYWYKPMPDADRTAVAITWHSDLANVLAGKEVTPRVGIDLMLNGGAGGLPAEDIIADLEQNWPKLSEVQQRSSSDACRHLPQYPRLSRGDGTQPSAAQRLIGTEYVHRHCHQYWTGHSGHRLDI